MLDSRPKRRRPLLSVAPAVAVAFVAAGSALAASAQRRVAPEVLVFSRTAAFRHASIRDGVQAVRDLGREHGFDVTATESPEVFSDDGLAPLAAVVFLNTTGDVAHR